MSQEDLPLSSYTALVWKSRRQIGFIAGTTTLIAALAVFLLPPVYEATSTLLTTSTTDKTSLFGRLGLNLDDLGLQGSGSLNSPIAYPEILRSRRILSKVLSMEVRRSQSKAPVPLIDIMAPIEAEPKRTEKALKALRSNLSAVIDRKTGLLIVKYRSRFPLVAANVTNALDSLLVDFTIGALASQAGKNRQFIEERLAESQAELAASEMRLAEFHTRNVRFGSSPRLNLEESRLSRALRAEEEVYLTLRRQHELARIEERRDTPSLMILDSAAVPAFKTWPKRLLTIGFAVLIGCLLGISWVVTTTKPSVPIELMESNREQGVRPREGHAGG